MAHQPITNISKADWLAKVERDLRGKPLDAFNWSLDGHAHGPFFHRDDLDELPQPVVPSGRPELRIGETLTVSDPEAANARLLQALEQGVSALLLDFGPNHSADPELLDRCLTGVYREMIDLFVRQDGRFTSGHHRRTDRQPGSAALAELLADGGDRPTHCWVRTDHDYFLTIAYLRALRRGWAELGYTGQLTVAASVPADSELDEHTNKIAATTQAMAAVIGGADLLFVEPSDGGEGTPFTRRIARNISHLLLQESHLDRVADAGAGSYYLETLTAQLVGDALQKLRP